MSIKPLTCRKCDRECVFDRMGPSPGGGEAAYAVRWRCPGCSALALDICPLGPLVPSPSVCLGCGAPYPKGTDDFSCGACGLPRASVLAALGIADLPAEPLAAAHDAFRCGLIRRGLAILNLALQHDPGLADAWSMKCSFLDALGFTRTKNAMLEAALAVGPPALWVSYAYTLQQLDRHADAVQAYRRYLGLLPDGPLAGVACCNQANSLALLDDAAGADALYRQALALEPERLTHHANYARFLLDARRWPEALPVIEAALPRASADADVIALLEYRALVFLEQNKGQEALESIEAARARGWDTARTHYLRGRALAQLARLEEARTEILHVLTLDPENAEGQQALETIDSVLLWGRSARPADLG